MDEKYDFGGWATRNNIRCSDGRTIMKDAFKDCDGKSVPMVWNHNHSSIDNVLGHALLENRDEGVYAYCTFNDTEQGRNAKTIVTHGDVEALSICANQLREDRNGQVFHGAIREVSLVLAGANPGAYIENVMNHGEESTDEAIIFTGEEIALYHDDSSDEETNDEDELSHAESDKADSDTKPKSVQDVLDDMTEEQKEAVAWVVASVIEKNESDDTNDSEGGSDEMKHNVFDIQTKNETETNDQELLHSAMLTIIGDAKRFGSMKESFLQHAAEYGIDQVDYLFPDAKSLNTPPEFIKRETGWVSKVMGAVHHSPFSRIKSTFADITEDDARAKGYITGKLKKEEVFGLLKRVTTPTTVYKKQKMDRDDVVDITDFDVIAWLKSEMRMMLDEELARAYLIGDGRLASSEDKINEQNIRPIWKDEALFTIRKLVEAKDEDDSDTKARAFIRAAIKARKDYRGSGNPTLWTTEDMLTDCLLMEDKMGRVIYDSVDKLATVLRVKEIVTVPVMEGLTIEATGSMYDGTVTGHNLGLMGLIVNLSDYNVGADKGGAINMFEDFDIDYNQQKYLIETRCSGALTKPFSAIAIEIDHDAA